MHLKSITVCLAVLTSCLALSSCEFLKKPTEPLPLGEEVRFWKDGIGLGLRPPGGYYASEGFFGFYRDSVELPIICQVLDRYFPEYKEDYSEENFKTTGVKLFEREEMMVDGLNALFLRTEIPYMKELYFKVKLGMQVGSRTVELEAMFPAASGKGFEDEIKQSFLTLRRIKEMDEAPVKEFPYSVQADSAQMKLDWVMGNTAAYVPKLGGTEEDEVCLLITHIPLPLVSGDTASLALEWLHAIEIIDTTTTELVSKRSNGIPVYVATAIGNRASNSIFHFYQVLWFGKHSIHRLLAATKGHYAEWQARFQLVEESFRATGDI